MSMTIGAKTAQPPYIIPTDIFMNPDIVRDIPKYRDAGPYNNERDALAVARKQLMNAPNGTTFDIFVRSWAANNRDFYVIPRDLSNPEDMEASIEALRRITGNYYITRHAEVKRHGNQIQIDPVVGPTISVPVRDMR